MNQSTLRKLLGRPASKLIKLPKGFGQCLKFFLKDSGGGVFEPSTVSISRHEAAELARRGALVEISKDRPWLAVVDASWIGLVG